MTNGDRLKAALLCEPGDIWCSRRKNSSVRIQAKSPGWGAVIAPMEGGKERVIRYGSLANHYTPRRTE